MNSRNKSTILVVLSCLLVLGFNPSRAQDRSKFPTGSYKLRGAPMIFKEDGTFKIGDDQNLFVEGRYEVKGDRISLTDTGGQYACKGEGERTGSYRWESKSEGLTFHLVKDGCEARRTALLEGLVAKAKE